MRFALLGDHPDGLDMARALAASGRHEIVVYSGSAIGLEYLGRWRIAARSVGDMEEVLADPEVEAVIVAGKPADRPAQLRRALQSERHVLCVHPADDSPDLAYEAAMIQGDTGMILLPLVAEALHPALRQMKELLTAAGELRLVEMERWSTDTPLLETGTPGHDAGLPGWDVLRFVGGEIIEIVGLAPAEEMQAEEPVLLSGRFERGGLLQVTLLPQQAEARWRLTVRTTVSRLELQFPDGWPGAARLTWIDEQGQHREETWDPWDPWAALVEVFEERVGRRQLAAVTGGQQAVSNEDKISSRPLGPTLRPTVHGPRPILSWQDEVRCLELDDAARRSIERRRASTLEYQEATEEATFKGTMTLAGCSLLWGSLILLLLSAWLPFLGWLILPVFGLFLLLQLLRWVVPPRPPEPRA
jgi:predicted dehydrogenase